MKESYSEVLARHAGPELYADCGNTLGVATTGGHAGAVLSSVNLFLPCADVVQIAEGNIERASNGKHAFEHGGVEDLVHVWKIQAREPGEPIGLLDEVAGSGQRTPLEAMLT